MLSFLFSETKKLATNRLRGLVPDIINITSDVPSSNEVRQQKKQKVIDNDRSDIDEGNSHFE